MLRTLFILSIFVPGFYAAVRSRYAALLMYLWFALFRPQDWVWIDITSLRLSMLLGLVLIIPALFAGLYPNVKHPLSRGMILFLGISLGAQVSAVRPDVGWVWIDYLFRLFLTCTLLVTLAAEQKRLLGVVAVVGGSLGFHAAKAGLAFLIGGGMRFSDGLAGAFVDNNGYALGTVMIMPFLFATAQNVDLLCPPALAPWIRRGLYASVFFCLFAVIGTYSRGGFLALSAAILTFVLLQRRRFTAIAALVAACGLLLAVVPIPSSYIERLETIRSYETVGDDSAMSRPHFWEVGVRMAMSNPFGIGLRQYEAAYDAYDFLNGRYGRHRAVHSSHFQVLAEIGFAGAAVWAALWASAYFICIRVRARSREQALAPDMQRFLFTVANALLTSMTAFVVGGAFLSAALNDLTWLTFGMVAALDLVSRQTSAQPVAAAVPVRARIPLAFRAVETFATGRGAGT